MGWSCSRAAGQVMDRWIAFCVKSTGSQNVYKNNGKEYFLEYSNEEYDDGAITGEVMQMFPNNMCRAVSKFRINGDGTIAQAPDVLKDL